MKHQEKKYLVDSFTNVQKILNDSGAKKVKEVVSTHYYVEQEGNDVVKLVKYSDRNEIHILKESQGKYSLTENIPVESTEAGLKWLKNKGFKVVNLVKMEYADYEYKNGIVGLYVINDFLQSVILDYVDGQHDAREKEFGLNSSQVINVPYNKLLEQMGRLQSVKL